MDTKVRELKRKIIEKNTTQEAVAMILGINRSTLYRKLQKGTKGLTLSEVREISNYLRLTPDETLHIFWS